jgi:hypothetical protein
MKACPALSMASELPLNPLRSESNKTSPWGAFKLKFKESDQFRRILDIKQKKIL